MVKQRLQQLQLVCRLSNNQVNNQANPQFLVTICLINFNFLWQTDDVNRRADGVLAIAMWNSDSIAIK